ncbi:MAG: aspartate kinase [Oscillospiraceae bacterium]|nr:aspartate kinase [Oscillospiraceae bacterium]
MLTVQKFGGSSLADAEGLCRAAALCIRERQKGRDAVMVVSAMGETTDELLAMAYSVSPAPSARELDALMSTGECSSAALAAIALEAQGQRAVSLSGWQSGIFTDAVHGDAQITTLTAARVRAALAHGIVPVITGFQGIDNSGDVTTLGRGGSDTTAVALAAALRAERCDIYSDVPGIFTADPRLVPTARLLDKIDSRDMLRLSYAGAQVLEKRSMELALEKGVELSLRSSSGEGEGTEVRVLGESERPELAGLALRGGTLTLVGRGARAMLPRLQRGLEDREIQILDSALSRDQLCLELPREKALRGLRALHEICFE